MTRHRVAVRVTPSRGFCVYRALVDMATHAADDEQLGWWFLAVLALVISFHMEVTPWK